MPLCSTRALFVCMVVGGVGKSPLPHLGGRMRRALWLQQGIWLSCWLILSLQAWGAKPERDRLYSLSVGSTQTIRVGGTLEKVFVGDPNIVDLIAGSAVPAGQVLLIAKNIGETQIVLWTREYGGQTIKVVTGLPTIALQEALQEMFPQEERLAVQSVGGAMYLTGEVSDAVVAEQAQKVIMNHFANLGKQLQPPINLTTIAKAQQVQVHLRFLEITRSAMRQLGFSAWVNQTRQSAAFFPPGPQRSYPATDDLTPYQARGGYDPVALPHALVPNSVDVGPMPILQTAVRGSFELAFGGDLRLPNGGLLPISATLGMLENRGVVKTLSEPTVVALSGQQAKFLSGGEFPMPIPDSFGRITVSFKPYGVQLQFLPTVLAQETINLDLTAEVSELDKTNGITVAGTSIPGISTRQSSSTVRLRSGQSFAIAGLITDKIYSVRNKMPFLGDFPLVGSLFRTLNYERTEQELVVLVTVKLVRPNDNGLGEAASLEDEFTDPSDVELFLFGEHDKVRLAEERPAKDLAAGGMPMLPQGAVGFSR